MLMPLLYINDISSVISNSTVKLFADDVTIYREIVCPTDADSLQSYLSNVVEWAKHGCYLISVKVLCFLIKGLHLYHIII